MVDNSPQTFVHHCGNVRDSVLVHDLRKPVPADSMFKRLLCRGLDVRVEEHRQHNVEKCQRRLQSVKTRVCTQAVISVLPCRMRLQSGSSEHQCDQVYDYLGMLPLEVKYIWKGDWTTGRIGRILYFMTRYVCIVDLVIFLSCA